MIARGGHQNKAWAENKSSFGFKMLQKMGWSEGKGLGKHEDGQSAHVRVEKRSDRRSSFGPNRRAGRHRGANPARAGGRRRRILSRQWAS